jgi:hypothetical protein
VGYAKTQQSADIEKYQDMKQVKESSYSTM